MDPLLSLMKLSDVSKVQYLSEVDVDRDGKIVVIDAGPTTVVVDI